MTLGIDNLNMEPIMVSVQADYDNGPFISVTARHAGGPYMIDFSFSNRGAVREFVKQVEEAEKEFLKLLDSKDKDR